MVKGPMPKESEEKKEHKYSTEEILANIEKAINFQKTVISLLATVIKNEPAFVTMIKDLRTDFPDDVILKSLKAAGKDIKEIGGCLYLFKYGNNPEEHFLAYSRAGFTDEEIIAAFEKVYFFHDDYVCNILMRVFENKIRLINSLLLAGWKGDRLEHFFTIPVINTGAQGGEKSGEK